MRRTVVAMALALIAIVIAVVVSKIRAPAKSSVPRPEEILPAAVAEANKQMPMMIDSATRMDRASSAGKVLTYHYTLLQRPAPGETLEQLQANVPAFEEKVTKKICADDKLRPMLDLGVTMRYSYLTVSGAPAFEFAVTQDSCIHGLYAR
jgi:hypothetical protein